MESIEKLRKKCRKSLTPEQWKARPWFTEKVTRRTSIYLTWLFLRVGLTANHVSFLVCILGLLSGVAFIVGEFLWAVLILQVWYLLDAVDGEIARYYGVDDLTGDYCDKLMHYVIEAWIFYAIAVGLANKLEIPWMHYVGIWVFFFFTLLKLIYDLKYKCFIAKAQNSQVKEVFLKKEIEEHHQLRNDWMLKILKTYSLYPNVMNVITVVVVLDSFWVGFQWMNVQWSSLSVLLLSYALFYPLACVKGLYSIIRIRGVDREYEKIFSFRDSDLI